jgi:DNA-binding transcriptional MerR regulator
MQNLTRLANKLSLADIKALLTAKRKLSAQGAKQAASLQKKRDKLAASLAKLDKQLAALGPESAANPAPKRRRARKPAVKQSTPEKKGRRGRPAKKTES